MVYGDLDERNQNRNWDDLRELGHCRRGPQTCIGNFNNMHDQNKKVGGLQRTIEKSKDSMLSSITYPLLTWA